jgi:hypothetical protein
VASLDAPGSISLSQFTDVDKLIEKLIELACGGLFFEHPPLIPIAIAVLTVIFGYYRYRYLWNHDGERGFGR